MKKLIRKTEIKYKVLKPFGIFNTRWNVGDIISEIDIDWVYSQNTKEYLILDGWIEEIDKGIYA